MTINFSKFKSNKIYALTVKTVVKQYLITMVFSFIIIILIIIVNNFVLIILFYNFSN